MYEDISGVFIGIGVMTLLFVFAWWLYQIGRIYKSAANVDEKYSMLEEIGLDKVAKKKGIDLNKEVMKRAIIKKRAKSFRRRTEDEMFKEMFGKIDEE